MKFISTLLSITLLSASGALSAQSAATPFVSGSATDEAAIRAIVATQSADQEDPHVASDLDWENAFGIRYTNLKKRNDWFNANVKPQFKDATNVTLEVKVRFLESTVAVADEYWHVAGQVYAGETKPGADRWGRTTYIFKKENGAWIEVMERVADLRSAYFKHYDALPTPVPVAAETLSCYAGSYVTAEGKEMATISVSGDRLAIKTRRGAFVGIPISSSEFLTFDPNDLASYYRITFGTTPGSPTPNGSSTSTELKRTITLSRADGTLVLAGSRIP